jgi:hypothetical protein
LKISLDKKQKIIVVLALCLVASFGSYALAATYIYNMSNTVTGHGNSPAPTPIDTALVLTPTTWTQGDQITLTATLSKPISGVVIFFYEGTGPSNWVGINQATTDSNGVASITFTGPVGDHTYVAQPQQ